MEEKTKRHVITPVKGICKAPSDLTCDDEQLKECEGMVMLNGELVPLQYPKATDILINGKLLYVHDYEHVVRYIWYDNSGRELYYTTKAKPKEYNYLRIQVVMEDDEPCITMRADYRVGYYAVRQKVSFIDRGGNRRERTFEFLRGGLTPEDEPEEILAGSEDEIQLVGDVILDATGGESDSYTYLTLLPGQEEPPQDEWETGVLLSNVDVKSVASIGNTLIVKKEDGVEYILWKNGYQSLGAGIPQPNFIFSLKDDEEPLQSDYIDIATDVARCNDDNKGFHIFGDFETPVMALYSAVKNKCSENKKFMLPFFVRGAVELIDGTYAYITNPILMFPNIGDAVIFESKYGGEGGDPHRDWVLSGLTAEARASKLYVQQLTDYSNYSDIIKGLTIFITNPLEIYEYKPRKQESRGEGLRDYIYSFYGLIKDELVEQIGEEEESGPHIVTYWKGCGHHFYNKELTGETPGYYNSQTARLGGGIRWSVEGMEKGLSPDTIEVTGPYLGETIYSPKDVIVECLVRKSDADIINTFKTCHDAYYKLCDIRGLRPLGIDTSECILSGVMPNITSQPRIENEDYFGWTEKNAKSMLSINERLIQYDFERTFFKGFYQQTGVYATDGIGLSRATLYVRIKCSDGNRVVKSPYSYHLLLPDFVRHKGYWFYYPDPRADHFWITSNGEDIIYEGELTESYQLNGAYHINEIPNDYIDEIDAPQTIGTFAEALNSTPEEIKNSIIQSDVDNPFSTTAAGNVRIGSGDVLGIAGLTTALTNDAYKVSTIICFTTQGIWALLTNNEGVIVNVPPPFSREVCSNPGSITMIDNSVVFVSARGLFLVTDRGCECISTQMNGTDRKGFIEYLQTCRIAYDYKRNLLIMYQEGEAGVWIYNLNSKTFSTDNSFLDDDNEEPPLDIITSAGQYPDVYLQGGGKIFSLMNTPERDDDNNTYSGSIESRPMKLDGSLYLKSLRRVRSLKLFNDNAIATLTLYGSNDLKHWSDNPLPSLNGKGYRFFKYRYEFTNLKATDSYSGLVLDTQVRYTDRPH